LEWKKEAKRFSRAHRTQRHHTENNNNRIRRTSSSPRLSIILLFITSPLNSILIQLIQTSHGHWLTMSYNVTNTTSPTLSPTYNDEPDEVVVRDFLGIFMLIMTLFVFVFAIWTYRVHLKRLFTKVSVLCFVSLSSSVIYFITNIWLFDISFLSFL